MSNIRYNHAMSNTTTLYNDEYKNKFRTMYLEGKTVKEINIALGFNQSTFESYQYLNFKGFRDWYQSVKNEYFIMKAEEFSRKLLSLNEDEDPRIYALKQKEVEFLRETLGRDIYSKKIEQDTIQPVTVNLINTAQNKVIEDVAKCRLSDTTTPQLEKPVNDTTPEKIDDVK